MPDESNIFCDDEPPPAVIFWFKVYAGFVSFLYFLAIGVSLVFLVVDPAKLEMDAAIALVTGTVMLALGLVLFSACLLPLILAQRPWLWTYDLVIICLGLTSVCFWPVCIPLLIFWLKPETKAYFGMT